MFILEDRKWVGEIVIVREGLLSENQKSKVLFVFFTAGESGWIPWDFSSVSSLGIIEGCCAPLLFFSYNVYNSYL